ADVRAHRPVRGGHLLLLHLHPAGSRAGAVRRARTAGRPPDRGHLSLGPRRTAGDAATTRAIGDRGPLHAGDAQSRDRPPSGRLIASGRNVVAGRNLPAPVAGWPAPEARMPRSGRLITMIVVILLLAGAAGCARPHPHVALPDVLLGEPSF